MPVAEALSIQPHLCTVFIIHAALAVEQGEKLLVKKGTKVVEVSEDCLKLERAML